MYTPTHLFVLLFPLHIPILCSLTIAAGAIPTQYQDPRIQQNSDSDSSLYHRGEHDLPPVSEVMMMAFDETDLPFQDDATSPTLLPHAMADFASSTSSTASMPLATTPPYTGPGILIIPGPGSSFSDLINSLPTHGTDANRGTDKSADNRSASSPIHHFAVVGGVVAGIILLTFCFFFLMDPCIWRPCCAARQERRRMARIRKARQKPLPSWMRVKPDYSFSERPPLQRKAPDFSTYSYALRDSPDSPKSKFSTSSSNYDCSEASVSFDMVVPPLPSSNLPYQELGIPTTPPVSNRNTHYRESASIQQPSTPVRPPRPPTSDSPTAIESIYYTDVDDHGFYLHPNPIVLVQAPPATSDTHKTNGSHAFSRPDSPAPYTTDGDIFQRHIRSQSAPSFIPSPQPSKRGGAIPTKQNVWGTGPSDDHSPTKSHRKSKSIVSWIRFPQLQLQHLRFAQQSDRSVLESRPGSPTDRRDIGCAH